MPQQPYLIIDFDSTFVSLESLDELAAIALADNPEQATIMQELVRITNLGMEGKIGFAESLELRVAMFRANRQHIEQLITVLREHITASVAHNADFLRGYADKVYIISGGFTDYIVPVVAEYGIRAEHVLANSFVFDEMGTITSYDKNCPLAKNNGKVMQLEAMQLDGPVYVIGDGYTDYQIRAAGKAEKFFAFTENVQRANVIDVADEVLDSFTTLVTELSLSVAHEDR